MHPNITQKMLSSAVTSLVLSTVALPGHGQSSEPSSTLEEVLVTAERRSEDLQTVPAAVTLIGAQQLESFRIARLDEMSSSVPNLIIRENTGLTNGAAIYLRGIGEDDSRIGAEPAIGVYIDDQYYGKQLGAMLDLLVDVESVEVLRGPQGTLYGRNANGGAIKITTRKPGDEFAARVTAGFGNYGAMNIGASLSGSLGDATRGQLAASVKQRDGFYDGPGIRGSETGEVDSVSAMGRLVHNWGDNWTIDVKGDYTSDSSDPNLSLGVGNGFTIPGGPATGFIGGSTIDDIFSETDISGLTVNLDGELGGLGFKSITGYRDMDNSLLTRLGFFYSQNSDFAALSQEFQLADNDGEGIDWIAGIYLYSEEAHLDSVFLVATADMDIDTRSAAVFGQAFIPLGDATTLTLGGRFTDESKDLVGEANFFGAVFASDEEVSDNFSDFRIAVDHRFSDDLMLYGSATSGTKSFGWSNDTLGFVEPEEILTYEVGVRGEFLDGNLRINATAFLNDYDNLQLNGSTSQGFTRFNVPNVETSGLEIEGAWGITSNLRIDFSLAVLKNDLTEVDQNFAAVVGAATIKEAQALELKNAPEFSGRIALSYERPIRSGGKILSTMDYSYSDEFFTLTANEATSLRESGGTLSARLAWYSAGDEWQLAIWGRNLTDEDFVTAAVVNQVYLTAPMTFGLDVTKQF